MNIMPEIAKLLNLKVNDEFMIIGFHEVYRFTEETLQKRPIGKDEWECEASPAVLWLLVKGKAVIEPMPFIPKNSQWYWSYDLQWNISDYIWTGDALDMLRKKAGIIYRTKDDALRMRKLNYKAITGEELP